MGKHKAIIKGRVYRKEFEYTKDYFTTSAYERIDYFTLPATERIKRDFSFGYLPYKVCEKEVLVEEKTLWEGDIDSPLLSEGESLYIEDLDVEVTVRKRVRTTNGDYIYKTDYKFENNLR